MIFSNKQRMSNFPSSEALCQNECGLALHSHTCVTENLETEPSPLLICEIIRGTEDGAQRGKRGGLTMGEFPHSKYFPASTYILIHHSTKGSLKYINTPF